MFENPAIDINPRTESTQRINSNPAICRRGERRVPIAQRITKKINISRRLIPLPLKKKTFISLMAKPGI